MTVIFFTNNFFPRLSGSAVSVYLLWTELIRKGVRCVVFCPKYHHGDDGDEVVRIHSIRFWWLRNAALPIPFFRFHRIDEIVRKIQPDIVHIHQPFLLGEVGQRLAKKYRRPLVFTYHTRYEEYGHYIRFAKSWSARWAKRRAAEYVLASDATIIPTEGMKRFLIDEGIEGHLEVIPTGVDSMFFGREARFKIQNDKILLYVGRMVREKNLEFLLQAFRGVVKSASRSVVLWMVGDGVEMRRLRRYSRRLGIEQNIRWWGERMRRELPAIYRSADLFVFPSTSDTQALVLYEALASGLPVVAVRSLASEAIVHSNENGCLVKENLQVFARAILGHLDFKTQHKIRELDPQKYSIETMADRMLTIYKNLTRSR